MVEITIDLRELGDAKRKLDKLSTSIRGKAGYELCDTVAKSLQRRMKVRAVLEATGQLKKSIKVVPIKYAEGHSEIAVTILDPRIGGPKGYAGAQGYGYRPHWIKGSFSSKSGYTFADWLIAKGYESDYLTAYNRWYFVKKQSPFVIPALDTLKADIPNIIDRWKKNVLRAAEFQA